MNNNGTIAIEVQDADWNNTTSPSSIKDLVWRASLSAKYNGDVKLVLLRRKSDNEVIVLFESLN